MALRNLENRKLIETAFPVTELNEASAYDKMPGIGPHPKGIHQWWARLPLPTARATIFASVVDDPSSHPEIWPSEEEQDAERERLLNILRELMEKKLHEKPEIYSRATKEMKKHCDGELPQVYDPFSGGGSIPLEAARLGLKAHARDLNPVAALINMCNLNLIPKWSEISPINPEDRKLNDSPNSKNKVNGLAADIRYYGAKIYERALESLDQFYPKVKLPKEYGDLDSEVISWIWARTVPSPNPAIKGIHVPLIKSYWLSNVKNNLHWLEPVIDRENLTYKFEIKSDGVFDSSKISNGTKLKGTDFKCIFTDDPISTNYIKEQAQNNNIGMKLLAVVTSFKQKKIYIAATEYQEKIANVELPPSYPTTEIPDYSDFGVQDYGIGKFYELFTHRQLNAMVTFSDKIKEIKEEITQDIIHSKVLSGDDVDDYTKCIITMLGLVLDRCVDFNTTLSRWVPKNQKVMGLFGRQFIPMIFDFAEANILGNAVGAWNTCYNYVAKCIETCKPKGLSSFVNGSVKRIDATIEDDLNFNNVLISTDPPYYDNIGYAALSDVFYVWLKWTLHEIYPDLFDTLLVPKKPELTAMPARFDGDRRLAKQHFESGFKNIFSKLQKNMDRRFPLTVYYAYKQADDTTYDKDSESKDKISLTTGWETLLNALITSGFQITGTWPVSASQKWRQQAIGNNALASYIILVCRPRIVSGKRIGSTQFREMLRNTLPTRLRNLQQGKIPPVDFAQASIGPGMSVYSQYDKILDSDGKPISVRTALGIINQTLAEVLSDVEDFFDAETRWAISWFEEFGYNVGPFGKATLLSQAKVTTVQRLEQDGIIVSKGGNVQLIEPFDLQESSVSNSSSNWLIAHILLKIYYYEKLGEFKSAEFLHQISNQRQSVLDLAYRLYDICERKKYSKEAQGYNALIIGWTELEKIASEERNFSKPNKLF